MSYVRFLIFLIKVNAANSRNKNKEGFCTTVHASLQLFSDDNGGTIHNEVLELFHFSIH